jgi:hypothetical protein
MYDNAAFSSLTWVGLAHTAGINDFNIFRKNNQEGMLMVLVSYEYI